MAEFDRLGRRDALRLLGAVALPLITPARALTAAKPLARIDFHYHPMAPEWVDAVAASTPPDFVARMRAWTPEGAIAEMDRNGIQTAVLSISSPGVWFGDLKQARRLARSCNEYMASMVRAYPQRFAMLAALPLPDVEASLAELAHAYDVLKCDGIGIATSYDDKWPADPLFAPIFSELNRRAAVVYLHPAAPSCCRKLVPGMPSVLLEYPVDTSRAMLQWILRRGSEHYPQVKMVFAHSGGLLLAGLGRLNIVSDTQPEFGLPKDFGAEIAKFYYEISSSGDEATMRLLRSYVPASHILLGTDSPIGNGMAHNLAQFDRLHLSRRDRESIGRGNALALLPRLNANQA